MRVMVKRNYSFSLNTALNMNASQVCSFTSNAAVSADAAVTAVNSQINVDVGLLDEFLHNSASSTTENSVEELMQAIRQPISVVRSNYQNQFDRIKKDQRPRILKSINQSLGYIPAPPLPPKPIEFPLVQFKILSARASTPQAIRPHSSYGVELISCEDVFIPTGHFKIIPVDLLIKIPSSLYGTVYPVSNLGKLLKPVNPLIPGGQEPHSLNLSWFNCGFHQPISIPKGRIFGYIAFSKIVYPDFRIITNPNTIFM